MKKVFDIIPPERPLKIEEIPKKPEAKPFKWPDFFKKGWFFGLVFLFAALLFCYFFIKSSAQIEIWPEAEISNFKTQLTISSLIQEPDFSKGIILGEILESEGIVSEEFVSSGKKIKEGKAKGTIRVYNAYSTSPQVLRATTRFVSEDGKLFRTPERVVIPGGSYEKGKFVPGFRDVFVEAAEPGEDYNIGPSTFSIPGFAGTARYTKFYGKSFSPMEGGFKKEVSYVSQEDLDRAREILKEKALEKSKDSLKQKITSDLIMIEGTTAQEITEISPLAEVGQEIDHFSVQVKAKAKTLVFKKSDLENFAKNYILSQIPEDKDLWEESLKINYSPKKIDLPDRITLFLDLEGKIFSKIDQKSLKDFLRGKSLTEAKIFLEGEEKIIKAEVSIQPFWAKRIPEDPERIEIKLRLD